MKATNVLGMVKIEGHPDPLALADRYSMQILDHATGRPETVRFAFCQAGAVFLPPLCYRGEVENPRSAADFSRYFPPTDLGKLRPYQLRALEEWLRLPAGCLQSAAGSGKTVVGAYLIASRGVVAVVIVPTVDIANQWRDAFEKHIGIKAGVIGGGSDEVGEAVTIVTFQSAVKRPELLGSAGLVLVDEAHRTPCRSIRDILALSPAVYRYGCTATPWRSDGLHRAMYWLLGGVKVEISREEVGDHVLPVTVREVQTGATYYEDDHNALQNLVAEDAERNGLLSDIIDDLVRDGHCVVALGSRVGQLCELEDSLTERGVAWCTIYGGTKKSDRAEYIDGVRSGAFDVLLATYQLAAEGLDVPELSALVMLSPLGNPTKIEQAGGRIARPCPGKLSPIIVDPRDSGGMVRGLAGKRDRVYSVLNWKKESSQ